MSIHVGDTVLIKSWDEMAKEYGTSYSNDVIECPNMVFTRTMDFLCNQLLTVRDFYSLGSHLSIPTYEFKFKEECANEFIITNFMIKRVVNAPAQVQQNIKSLFED